MTCFAIQDIMRRCLLSGSAFSLLQHKEIVLSEQEFRCGSYDKGFVVKNCEHRVRLDELLRAKDASLGEKEQLLRAKDEQISQLRRHAADLSAEKADLKKSLDGSLAISNMRNRRILETLTVEESMGIADAYEHAIMNGNPEYRYCSSAGATIIVLGREVKRLSVELESAKQNIGALDSVCKKWMDDAKTYQKEVDCLKREISILVGDKDSLTMQLQRYRSTMGHVKKYVANAFSALNSPTLTGDRCDSPASSSGD